MFATIHGKEIPIKIADKLPESCISTILKWGPFTDWVSSLDDDFIVSAIEVQSLDMFGDRVGFAKIKCNVTSKSSGKRVPGIVFMRGGSVAILPIVTSDYCEQGCNEFVLLTEQPRFGSCSSKFWEIPAGMLDGEGHFVGVAAKELEEETSIKISEDCLIDMTKELYEKKRAACGVSKELCAKHHHAMLLTPGGSDEFMPVYLFRATISAEQLRAITSKIHGVDSEHISVRAVPFKDLPMYVQDAKSLAAYGMYRYLYK